NVLLFHESHGGVLAFRRAIRVANRPLSLIPHPGGVALMLKASRCCSRCRRILERSSTVSISGYGRERKLSTSPPRTSHRIVCSSSESKLELTLLSRNNWLFF